MCFENWQVRATLVHKTHLSIPGPKSLFSNSQFPLRSGIRVCWPLSRDIGNFHYFIFLYAAAGFERIFFLLCDIVPAGAWHGDVLKLRI